MNIAILSQFKRNSAGIACLPAQSAAVTLVRFDDRDVSAVFMFGTNGIELATGPAMIAPGAQPFIHPGCEFGTCQGLHANARQRAKGKTPIERAVADGPDKWCN